MNITALNAVARDSLELEITANSEGTNRVYDMIRAEALVLIAADDAGYSATRRLAVRHIADTLYPMSLLTGITPDISSDIDWILLQLAKTASSLNPNLAVHTWGNLAKVVTFGLEPGSFVVNQIYSRVDKARPSIDYVPSPIVDIIGRLNIFIATGEHLNISTDQQRLVRDTLVGGVEGMVPPLVFSVGDILPFGKDSASATTAQKFFTRAIQRAETRHSNAHHSGLYF